MKGLREVFSFTLKQQLKVRSVKILTIVISFLLIVVPIASMVITELNRSPEEITDTQTDGFNEDQYNADGISSVFVFSDDSEGIVPKIESGIIILGCENTEFISCASYKEAKALAAGRNDTVILSIKLSNTHEYYDISAILPDGSEMPSDKALYVADCVSYSLRGIIVSSLNTDPETAEHLSKEFYMSVTAPENDSELMTAEDALKEEILDGITMALPYLNIMIIYFLVLYYGQSVANSVILEKTSKLMDTFLISVKPKAMIFGKVLATWCAALIQFLSWVICGILGFGIGAWAVRLINPDSPMVLLKVFELLKIATGSFALADAFVSVLLILGGFFLYCCMAGIAGSFASKPEELSSTISIFTLTLVVSMLITLKTGFIDRDMGMGAAWFDFVPFTATLITPSRMLLGYISLGTGLLSLGCTALLSVLFILIAGKVYSMMSLYKGKVPSFKDVIGMLRA